ncbi:hypothetical protein [Methylomonas sp. AM2-LC]|uniref:hypothetical protein n=1 Tax=Methylomonas sp. AM2-LC TaxID=3153301 RepID=UPI0032638DE4
MDNDILINQARQLYVVLHTLQLIPSMENTGKLERLEHLIRCAYWRYVRRLNRCALCYQYRSYECIRVPGKKRTPCARRLPTNPVVHSPV